MPSSPDPANSHPGRSDFDLTALDSLASARLSALTATRQLLSRLEKPLPPVQVIQKIDAAEVEKIVQAQSSREQDLRAEIDANRLVPLTKSSSTSSGSDRQMNDSLVSIAPEQECMIIVLYTPFSSRRKYQPEVEQAVQELIFVKLLQEQSPDCGLATAGIRPTQGEGGLCDGNHRYTTSISESVPTSTDPNLREEGGQGLLRVRELPLRAKVFKSYMSVAQKNINFGRILSTESRTKTVGLSNHSVCNGSCVMFGE